ncbi:hypothetical protein Vafri_14842 [Volvox africanus]|uniref:Uncharacterized protein n=1 Tax=Volvox africanus TaxID=51714 RepID=A0A8J4F5A3_9CHLO|nr:hypothetical protein Vafri_14842 [Volvox africanus]
MPLVTAIDACWFRSPKWVRTRRSAATREGWLAAAAAVGPAAAAAASSSPSALFSTDLLTTLNPPSGGQDSGLERSCDPSYSLNTGVYWVSGAAPGARLMRGWLALREASDLNDDQQALNVLVRGTAMELRAVSLPTVYDLRAALAAHEQQQAEGGFRGGRHATKRLGVPRGQGGELRHTYLAAGAPGVAGAEADGVVVSCLPVSSFSHTYAFTTSRLHEARQHPLYEVHWVWGGKSLESKRQCMRDAMVFADPPDYHNPHRVMTFELAHQEMPPGYNSWPSSRTSEMVDFALPALSAQLQQAYWALALAMALNRTLVLPQFRCYCAKNWFATSACRINSERDTVFPFPCPLSHIFRSKLLLSGELRVEDSRPHPRLGPSPSVQGTAWRVADVRESAFLNNPRTEESLRFATRYVLRVRSRGGGADDAGNGGSSSSSNRWSHNDKNDYGSSDSDSGTGTREIVLDRPRTDRELQDLLLTPEYDAVRVLHVPRPATVMSGFADALMWQQYDTAVQRVTATWCCHSTREAALHGGSRRERLQPLPPSRQQQRGFDSTSSRTAVAGIAVAPEQQ